MFTVCLGQPDQSGRKLARYWSGFRRVGDPLVSPAIGALAEIRARGRSVEVYLGMEGGAVLGHWELTGTEPLIGPGGRPVPFPVAAADRKRHARMLLQTELQLGHYADRSRRRAQPSRAEQLIRSALGSRDRFS